ncbi:Ubiquitin family protein [Globisporangium polare]
MVAHENQTGVADDTLPALEAAADVAVPTENVSTGDPGATTPTTTAAATAHSGSDLNAAAADAGDSLRIRLKLLDERVVEVEAPPAMSVADFRVKVAHATQVPVYRQRLIYRGKLMKDGSALSTYDIQDGHTVHLVAKPIQSAGSASANGSPSNVSATASSSNTNNDGAGGQSTGPRFTFANRDDDDDGDFVGSAVRRNREYLRRLMSSEDTLNREDAEIEASRRHNLREPSVLRPQTTTRRRIPGPGEPTGAAWNMGVLREALGGQSGSSDTRDETATRLHGLRELFGDDVLEEASPSSVASEVGLGSSVLNGNGSSADEPRANLDHIVQGMMTLRTVLSTVAIQPEAEQRNETVQSEIDEEEEIEDTDMSLPNQPIASPTSAAAGGARSRLRRGRRRFFVGQWLDVKDTVNQWLECTVMDISEDKVLIHYHGWPSRWDEWIDFDSNRIAAFRTRTVHTVNSQHMSPMPLTRLPNAPRIGNPDICVKSKLEAVSSDSKTCTVLMDSTQLETMRFLQQQVLKVAMKTYRKWLT